MKRKILRNNDHKSLIVNNTVKNKLKSKHIDIKSLNKFLSQEYNFEFSKDKCLFGQGSYSKCSAVASVGISTSKIRNITNENTSINKDISRIKVYYKDDNNKKNENISACNLRFMKAKLFRGDENSNTVRKKLYSQILLDKTPFLYENKNKDNHRDITAPENSCISHPRLDSRHLAFFKEFPLCELFNKGDYNFNTFQKICFEHFYLKNNNILFSPPLTSRKNSVYEFAISKVVNKDYFTRKNNFKIIFIYSSELICKHEYMYYKKRLEKVLAGEKLSFFSMHFFNNSASQLDEYFERINSANFLFTTAKAFEYFIRIKQSQLLYYESKTTSKAHNLNAQAFYQSISLIICDYIMFNNDENLNFNYDKNDSPDYANNTKSLCSDALLTRLNYLKEKHKGLNYRLIYYSPRIARETDRNMLAKYLNINTEDFLHFDETYDEIKIQKNVLVHNLEFSLDILQKNLMSEVFHIVSQNERQRRVLVLCSNNEDAQKTALYIANAAASLTDQQAKMLCSNNLDLRYKNKLGKLSNSVADLTLKEMLSLGIAYNDTNLTEMDQKTVQVGVIKGNSKKKFSFIYLI